MICLWAILALQSSGMPIKQYYWLDEPGLASQGFQWDS